MIRFSHILAKLAAILCCLGLGTLPVQAQRKREKAPELAPAPPPVVSRSISLNPGETVAVPLTVHGTRDVQLEFVVRSQPKSGKLSKVKPAGREGAVVEYTAGDQPGKDRFTYAVRTDEGMSAPGLVEITIIAAPVLPARLGTVELLEFPEVVLGQRSSATLEVKNVGGGMAEGAVEVPEGWQVEGSPRYGLPAGQSTEFKLIFHPSRAGEFNGQAMLGPNPKRVVPLHGRAVAPLEMMTEALDLATKPGTQAREGILRVKNRTAEPRTLTIKAGPRILVEQSATVPPGETLELPVLAEAEDPAPVNDKLQLASGTWKAEVPVRAMPLGAMVKIGAEAPAFGKVRVGEVAEASVTLENTGGMPASVAVRVEPPFEVSAAGVPVPARGKTLVPVRLKSPTAGRVTTTFVAITDGREERLPLVADVEPGPETVPRPVIPPTLTPRGVRTAGTASPGRELAAEAPTGRTTSFSGIMPAQGEVPGLTGKYTRDTTSSSTVLEWPKRLGVGDGVSEQRLGLDAAKELKITWSPMTAEFSEAGGNCQAVLRDLQPGRLYIVKVTAGPKALFATKFWTLPKKPWLDLGWREILLIVLGLGVVGALGWKWKHRVKGGW